MFTLPDPSHLTEKREREREIPSPKHRPTEPSPSLPLCLAYLSNRLLKSKSQGGLGYTLNSSHVLEMYHLSQEQICGDLEQVTRQHPIVALTTWSWLPGVVQNPRVRSTFIDYFGQDFHGVIPLTATIGPLLLQPIRPLQRALEALRALRVSSFSVGIQIRAGGRLKVPKKHDAPVFTLCAYASLPTTVRATPITWFLVVDTPSLRKTIAWELVKTEGKIVGGHGDLLDLIARYMPDGAAAIQKEGFVHVDPPVELLPYQPVIIDFASGSRLIFLGRDVDTLSIGGVRHAVLEVWALGALTDLVVVTENSSFADMAHAMFPKPAYSVTFNGRCYPLMSNEPLGAGYQYTSATCYSPRMQQHTWLWQH